MDQETWSERVRCSSSCGGATWVLLVVGRSVDVMTLGADHGRFGDRITGDPSGAGLGALNKRVRSAMGHVSGAVSLSLENRTCIGGTQPQHRRTKPRSAATIQGRKTPTIKI